MHNTGIELAHQYKIISPSVLYYTVFNIVTIRAFNQRSLCKNELAKLIGNQFPPGGIGGLAVADCPFSVVRKKLCLSKDLLVIIKKSRQLYAFLSTADSRAPPTGEKHSADVHVKPNC